MKLSIILPFYYKCDEFRIALQYNKKFLKPVYELVIPIDEPNSEEEVLSIIKREDLNCNVTIRSNKIPHGWRNPAKAINVGLKNAKGEFSLIMSPESIAVTDVYSILITEASINNQISLGKVVFTNTLNTDIAQEFNNSYKKDQFYGSICGRTDYFYQVKGYNEQYEIWGGDDNDIRNRLAIAGYKLTTVNDAKVLHFEKERTGPKRNKHGQNLLIPFNNTDDWGTDF